MRRRARGVELGAHAVLEVGCGGPHGDGRDDDERGAKLVVGVDGGADTRRVVLLVEEGVDVGVDGGAEELGHAADEVADLEDGGDEREAHDVGGGERVAVLAEVVGDLARVGAHGEHGADDGEEHVEEGEEEDGRKEVRLREVRGKGARRGEGERELAADARDGVRAVGVGAERVDSETHEALVVDADGGQEHGCETRDQCAECSHREENQASAVAPVVVFAFAAAALRR